MDNKHIHSHDGPHHHHNAQISEQEKNDHYSQKKHQAQVKSAFLNYAKDMRMSYDKIYSQTKLNSYFEIVRQRKKQRMEKALQANQNFLNMIIDATRESTEQTQQFVPEEETMCHNISKIRTTVKQFFRQWCGESPQVKDYIYLVQIAKKYLKKKDKILVPGCGLGRLPLELIEAGFDTQGNEVTYFMLYGSNFILNCVERKEQYQIYPFIHTLANHQNQDDMFRSVRIPDKVASDVVPEDADFSMAAGEFTEIYRDYLNNFQAVITCFFIDTANNIFQYIDTIHKIIKPGGIWINYGPLLYHFKDMLEEISIELSWQQVRAYAQLKGFKLEEQQKKTTTYCHDPLASYTHLYDISMTVWRKSAKQ